MVHNKLYLVHEYTYCMNKSKKTREYSRIFIGKHTGQRTIFPICEKEVYLWYSQRKEFFGIFNKKKYTLLEVGAYLSKS